MSVVHNRAAGARKWTLLATSFGPVIVLTSVTIVNVAAPYIGMAFPSGVSGLQWIVNAYTLAFASFLLPAGAIADRYGSRIVFMAGLMVFAVASAACAFTQSLSMLVTARVFQGIGAALIFPTSLSLLANAYRDSDDARVRAVGIWSAIGGMVSAAGPALGGGLIAAFGWESIFLMNIPLCLAGLCIAWLCVAETPCAATKRFDVMGQLLAIAFFSVLTGTFIEAGARGWNDMWILSGIAFSTIVCVAFVVVEVKAEAPILPLFLLRHRVIATALCVGLIANLTFYGLIFVLSVYFQRVLGYSSGETGLAFSPFIFLMLGNLSAAPISVRFGFRIAVITGLSITASGYLLLGALLDARTSYALIFPCLLLMSLGGGLALPALTSSLLASVEPVRTATLSGVFNTGRQVGAALGVALFGILVIGDDVSQIAGGAGRAFLASFLLLVIAIALAAWFLPQRSPTERVRHE